MPFPLIPILLGVGAGGVIAELFDLGREFFGDGDPVEQPPKPPVAPPVPAGTNTPTEEKRNTENQGENGGIEEQTEEGNKTQGKADEVSADGRSKLDEIMDKLNQVAGRNASPDGGATPETEAANDQASRDALQQLRETLAGADSANRGLAGQLPGMGGMPGMGMGGMPGMGGGMNPLSGLGGLGGGSPMMGGGANPFTGQGEGAPMAPAANPLAMDTGGAEPPTPPVNPLADAGPGSQPDSPQHPPENPLSPDEPGHDDDSKHDAPEVTPQPAPAGANEVTGPDGEKITAPDATIKAVLNAALDNPGATNQAASAYQSGAGLTLPADGADPGELVPVGRIRPGDIARWDDPPQDLVVWGNGKVIGPDGKLAELDTMLRSGVFNAFFRPKVGNAAPASAAAESVDQPTAPPISAVP